MASTITADNGVSSGSAGLKSAADSSGVLALQTTTAGGAATTAVTVSNTQNIGVGTAAPSAWGSSYQALQLTNTSLWTAPAVGLTHLTTNAYYDGTNYKALLTGNATDYYQFAGTHVWQYAIAATGGSSFTWTEAMRIDSSGNLLVGTTSQIDGGKVSVSGSNCFGATITANSGGAYQANYTFGSGTAYYGYWKYGGSVVGYITSTGSTVNYTSTSDYRLKEQVRPMTGALAKVNALKPVTYKWKVDGSDGQGFIAHELQEVVPDAVVGEKDAVDAESNPVYQGIDTSFLVATLTAAIQELNAKFEEYKATHP